MKRTGFFYSHRFLDHETGEHPERPARLHAILSAIRDEGLNDHLIKFDPIPATVDQLSYIHDKGYIAEIERSCRDGRRHMDADTVICEASYEVALLAAGSMIQAVDYVFDGDIDNAFCCVRPPGHHAEHNRAMGFCLFNNIAIGAKYARIHRGAERVFIIDWDVHHGNGTQHSFYTDPSVFYFSSHLYPYYPGTGAYEETGAGEGEGRTLNAPLSPHQGDDKYREIFEGSLVPAIEDFKPDIILISAGFDAHKDDPLSYSGLTSSGFGDLTRIICSAAERVCHGKIVSTLEGGYNLRALGESVAQHLKGLLDYKTD